MNVQLPAGKSENSPVSRTAIADGDIHPVRKSRTDLYPFLSERWRQHLETFGPLPRQGSQAGQAYPKGQPNGGRLDAWPPGGGKPGSDLGFLRRQLLDEHNICFGVMNVTGENGQYCQNQDLGAALCRAINEWQVAEWTSKERRLKASIVVPYEDAPAAVAEIEHWAGHPDFVQVMFQSRSAEPFGQRRYWPIYEAAVRAGLPIGVHAFGFGGYPITGGGWPSYYIEETVGHAQACISLLTSMVVEGVFERFPGLKLVLIESGFGWLPSLGWRLDRLWKRLKQETPHLRCSPSETIRKNVWLTTQPMEEPENIEHLLQTIEWIGWDRLMFATDYPHWDFDDPMRVLPAGIDASRREQFMLGNALTLYQPK
jgi:hypothetical protein